MKPVKWTKSDAKRAAKMGWRINTIWASDSNSDECLVVHRIERRSPFNKLGAGPFKSNREAAEWVVAEMCGKSWINTASLDLDEQDWNTCRKAIILCLTGGAQ